MKIAACYTIRQLWWEKQRKRLHRRVKIIPITLVIYFDISEHLLVLKMCYKMQSFIPQLLYVMLIWFVYLQCKSNVISGMNIKCYMLLVCMDIFYVPTGYVCIQSIKYEPASYLFGSKTVINTHIGHRQAENLLEGLFHKKFAKQLMFHFCK